VSDVESRVSGRSEEIRETRLDNGIRVVTEHMAEARSVTLGVWAAVGGRDEPAHLAGASHFLEHLLFKGTETRSARQIAEAVDAVGGDINAFTAREHTAYYARLPADHVGLGLEILGDVLTAPAFRPHEIEGERQVILEEILMNLDLPEDHVHTLLSEAMFPGHPLGREVLGDPQTVEGMSRDDVASFFTRWYHADNLVVTAAGRLDHDVLVDAFAAAFAGLPSGPTPVRERPDRPLEPVRRRNDDTEQVHVTLGWRGLDEHHADRYAWALLNQVLGGGMASRLFQEVREERGLCYSVYSWVSSYHDAGMAGVYAATKATRLPELLAVLDAEVAKIAAAGISSQELAVALGYMEGSIQLGLEDSSARMARLGRSLLSRGEVITVDEQLARFRAVTVEDVARVAEAVYGQPRTVAVVGPVDGTDL
jgi:predicted Zn-dependent peptidase